MYADTDNNNRSSFGTISIFDSHNQKYRFGTTPLPSYNTLIVPSFRGNHSPPPKIPPSPSTPRKKEPLSPPSKHKAPTTPRKKEPLTPPSKHKLLEPVVSTGKSHRRTTSQQIAIHRKSSHYPPKKNNLKRRNSIGSPLTSKNSLSQKNRHNTLKNRAASPTDISLEASDSSKRSLPRSRTTSPRTTETVPRPFQTDPVQRAMAQHGLLVFMSTNPVYFAGFLCLEDCVHLALTNSKLARCLNPARLPSVREVASQGITGMAVGPEKQFGLWVWALGVRVSQERLLANPEMQERLPRPDSMVADVDCTNGDPSGASYACLEHLKTTGTQGEILRDITRTYPSHPLFRVEKGPGQQMLANVLFALTHYHSQVGYCQGMNFVAGALLICHMQGTAAAKTSRRWTRYLKVETDDEQNPFEGFVKMFKRPSFAHDRKATWLKNNPRYIDAMEDVFWVMTALLFNKLQMTKLWTKGVPQMKLRVYQFIEVLKAEMPQILSHLDRISLHPDILVTQWFLTLYAYTLPMEVVLRLWNCIFLDGWKAIFRIAVARLKEMEDQILSLDLEDMSLFLRRLRNQNGPKLEGQESSADIDPTLIPDINFLLKSSYSVNITNTRLKELEQEFEVQLLKERLAIGSGKQTEWLLRYGAQEEEIIDPTFIERMKMEIGNLTAPLRQDTPILQEKIVSASQRLTGLRDELKRLETKMMPMQADLEDLLERKKLFHQQIVDMVKRYQDNHENCKHRMPRSSKSKKKPPTHHRDRSLEKALNGLGLHSRNSSKNIYDTDIKKAYRPPRSRSASQTSSSRRVQLQHSTKNTPRHRGMERFLDASQSTDQSWVSLEPPAQHRRDNSFGSQILSFFFGGGGQRQDNREKDSHHRYSNSEPSLLKATSIKIDFKPVPAPSKHAPRPPGLEFVYNSDEDEENYFQQRQSKTPELRPQDLDTDLGNSELIQWSTANGKEKVEQPLRTMMERFNKLLLDVQAAKELEELRSDVDVLRLRISRIDEQFEVEKTEFVEQLTKYEALKVQHDEAYETKQALSSQLLQLIRESDIQVDKQLRKFAELFGGGKAKNEEADQKFFRFGSDDTYFMGAPYLENSPRKSDANLMRCKTTEF